MSKRRKSEPYVQVKINIPATINARLELAIWDPVLKKPSYGKRSEIITSLIQEWLERNLAQGQTQ